MIKYTRTIDNPKHTSDLEIYFQKFRANIIGNNKLYQTAYGTKKMLYADWTASGRLYRPIESKLSNLLGPFIGNTHTESTTSSKVTTIAYRKAQQIIKDHVHASNTDVLISTGTGATGAVNKLQRLLGLRAPSNLQNQITLQEEDRPIIFISHMEHHSNSLSWQETIGDVVMLQPDSDGCIDLQELEQLLIKYRNRKTKIGAFTACSNVTGLKTKYQQLARMMHKHNGICFIDFAASAPYVDINMHPDDPMDKLDGLFFSPHKFLGGPGSCGVLLVDEALIDNKIPDHPGGGTVLWTNYWGEYCYLEGTESREDGGTPAIIQTIKAALAIQLKEEMGTNAILQREEEMLSYFLPQLDAMDRITILGGERSASNQLGIISFCARDIHHHLFVTLLNDRFGIQARGGCSCAGPYGHHLLDISKKASNKMTKKAEQGDMSLKPGWVRISLHPTMTNNDLQTILFAIQSIVKNIEAWRSDYYYESDKDTFTSIHSFDNTKSTINQLFYI
ncbi:selenocysteine lyase/cysteine desulfurase [Natronobacillus azotifigens]|uniref:Aminotransferase class V-fold PLP-dependent enzyme n=1 Tax=Natronobacillus azotifigens TaxID=472978 RepID=A0A9J6RFG1_9BACI|nr:aminotransferase class V-fold PLP-dependent enzyme [Natronobacillus azotifigens]MCZ0704360.1 aminotransferase class V-fold PLP-dependent enzyme [Natronobacillus azotifigens]